MHRPLSRRGFLRTGVTLAAATAASPGGHAVDTTTALVERTKQLRLAFEAADPTVAVRLGRHARTIHGRLRDRDVNDLASVLADAAQSASMVLVYAGQVDQGLRWAETGHLAATQHGDRDLAAVNLMRQSDAYTIRGRHDLAAAILTQAEPTGWWARFGVETRVASARANKRDAYGSIAALDRAEAALDRAAGEPQPAYGASWGQRYLESWRAETALQLGLTTIAAQRFEHFRDAADAAGMPLAGAEARTGLALVAFRRGDVDAGCLLLAEAVPVLRQGGNARDLRRARAALGSVAPQATNRFVRELAAALRDA